MRKRANISIILIILMLFCGCNSSVSEPSNNNESNVVLGESKDYWNDKMEEIKFKDNYPDYYYELCNDEVFDGITIANYDISKITPVNNLQEVVEYGNIYGEKESGNYVQISLLDKNRDYSVNVNIENGDYSDELGNYFLNQNKDEYINEKIEMIKKIIE